MRHLALWTCVLVACAGTGATPDVDTGTSDTQVLDSEVTETDLTETDLADSDTEAPDSDDTDLHDVVPLDGFGDLTGACGVLSPAILQDPAPRLFRNALDVGVTLPYAPHLLSTSAQRVQSTPNRGGSSTDSEAISFDVLYRCERAVLIKTEAEIIYTDAGGKKTDILIEVDGVTLGTSVTRAFRWPGDVEYPVADAQEDLNDKLSDALLATSNVAPSDAWERQILHIVAWNNQHADAVEEAYAQVTTAVRSDTLVVLTVSHGNDGFIYGVDDPD
jgi:hypothetical protein